MRFLSIQSHVAYGHVGNRAAVFPLQRLGHDVWAVNTVQFSNHTGYGAWRGRVAAAEEIREVVEGVAELGVLARCDAVLTGYIGDVALGQAALDAVAKVRAANPKALWLCDPVIGDIGRGVFVRPGIAEFFRERACPAADILAPNHFELELLTGRAVATLPEAIAAARALLARNGQAAGPRLVLVTSLRRAGAPHDTVEMLAATAEGAWIVATPKIEFAVAPNGAGDAVAALFAAHFLGCRDPGAALGEAASAIWAVLDATARSGERELQLVAAQDAMVAPPRRFAARVAT